MTMHIDKMNEDKIKDLLVLSKSSMVASFIKIDNFIQSYLKLPENATEDELKTFTLANLIIMNAFIGSSIKDLTCFYDDIGTEAINNKIIKSIERSIERSNQVLALDKKSNQT